MFKRSLMRLGFGKHLSRVEEEKLVEGEKPGGGLNGEDRGRNVGGEMFKMSYI